MEPGRTDLAVYLAGPLGFFGAGQWYHAEVLVPALAGRFTVLDPWAAGEAIIDAYGGPDAALASGRLAAMNAEIGAANRALIDRSDAVLAVLDGPDVDSGTAAEIGYAAARDIPIIGLRTDLRLSGENHAAVVNLQLGYFITASGGRIVRVLDDAIAALVALARS